jgi:cytochrome c oxidase assembly protein subunit 11
MKKSAPKKLSKNSQTIILLAAGVACMGALAYASVPLYTLFCRATGLGGTTQRASAATTVPAQARMVTVRFDGNVDPSLPWEFAPEVRSINLKLGETALIKYRARNNGKTPLTGIATYNVQPDKAGAYFDKIQCFCFTKQTLQPGATVELPVQFYVDPEIAKNANTADVTNITLSYTFFLAKNQGQKVASPKPAPSLPNDDTDTDPDQ